MDPLSGFVFFILWYFGILPLYGIIILAIIYYITVLYLFQDFLKSLVKQD